MLICVSDKMGIFGVGGKLETQAHGLVEFQLRYIVDFDFQPRYRLRAAVVWPAGGGDNGGQVDVVQINMSHGHQQEQKRHIL